MKDYHVSRLVPNDRVQAYVCIGWKVLDERKLGTVVGKTLKTLAQYGAEDLLVDKPYAIQTGSIQRPFGLHDHDSLGKAVEFHNMCNPIDFGSDAMTKSLRRIESQWSLYRFHSVKSICANIGGREFPLQIYANFDTVNQETYYLESLMRVIIGDLCTSEPIGVEFVDRSVRLTSGSDFWWDVKTDVFFTFDKLFMARLNNHLQETDALGSFHDSFY